MKFLAFSMSLLIASNSLLAKDSPAKGVLPELQLNKKSEKDNIKTAAGAEALISKSEVMAIRQLEALLKKYRGTSQEPELLFRLAELYSRRAKTGRFVDLYRNEENILQILPPQITAVGAKNYLGLAIDKYKLLQNNFPQFHAMDEVLFNLAFAQDQKGESEAALGTFTLILDRFPQSRLLAETHMALGELYFQKRKYTEGKSHYDSVQKWPKAQVAPIALYKSAWCSYNLKETPEALQKLERLLKQSKAQALTSHVRSEARRDLALFYSEVGAADEALAYLKKHLLPNELGQTILDLSAIYERHGKLGEMDLVLSAFIKESPKDENAGMVHMKRAKHHNEHNRNKIVIESLQGATSLCRQEDWVKLTKETTHFCTDEYPATLKDYVAEWWETWNKKKRDPAMVQELAFIFQEYLSFEKAETWDPGVHISYADFQFTQNNFKVAADEYEAISLKEGVEPKALPTALYGVIVSLDKVLQTNPKDAPLREKLQNALNNYLQRASNAEFADDVRFKKAFLFYEQKDYVQSLEWLNKIAPKSEIMKNKRDDLILEIHRSKKDYRALAAASLLIWKASQGERANQIKIVYQSAQQAIIQQLSEKQKYDAAATLAKAFYTEHRPEPKALEALHLAIELWEKAKRYRPAAESSEILAKEMRAKGNGKEAETLSQHGSELFLRLGDLRRATESLNLTIDLAQDASKKKESLELLAEISSWYGDVDKTEKAWQALEPQMSGTEKSALLEKRLRFFEIQSPERAKKLKDSLISKGVEPFFSEAQVAQAELLCQRKQWSQCYQLAIKLSKDSTPAVPRSLARQLQARVLLQEYYQQSLKSSPERLAMVMAIKAEKFDKAVQVLNSISQKSEILSSRKQAVQDLIALYNNYVTQLQTSLGTLDRSNQDQASLKAEIDQIIPVLAQRPKELETTLTEIDKMVEAPTIVAKSVTVTPFPELNGSELRIYVPSWEETSIYRPLADLKVSAKGCDSANIAKIRSMSSLGREANACLAKGKHQELEAAALKLSDLFPDTQWGPFYLAVSAVQQKSLERALWYLKLAEKREHDDLIIYEETRQQYTQTPDSKFAPDLKKMAEVWKNSEEARFLTALENIKQNQCEDARDLIKELRAQHWQKTGLNKITTDRCPTKESQTVTSVN